VTFLLVLVVLVPLFYWFPAMAGYVGAVVAAVLVVVAETFQQRTGRK
jgi:hypothetical protein